MKPDVLEKEINSADASPEATTADRESAAMPKTLESAATFVPAKFRFTETPYEPTPGVTSEELSKLSQDDLLTALGKQYRKSRDAYGQFGRDLTTLVKIYDAVVARYKHERVSVNRNGEPTLQQAFFAIGWNYEAARKMKQRYNTSLKAALPS